jgi:hypothetical protein
VGLTAMKDGHCVISYRSWATSEGRAFVPLQVKNVNKHED